MSLRHFEPEVGVAPVLTSTVTVTVEQVVTVAPRPSMSRAFVAKEQATWDWSDLRDYVVAQIEQRFGPFPRDAKKEAGIFKSFISRHPDEAVSIAKFAFEVENGYWAGAPISVNRFCKASDPYFADKIKPRMMDQPVAGW
jgi:hypothetical protein